MQATVLKCSRKNLLFLAGSGGLNFHSYLFKIILSPFSFTSGSLNSHPLSPLHLTSTIGKRNNTLSKKTFHGICRIRIHTLTKKRGMGDSNLNQRHNFIRGNLLPDRGIPGIQHMTGQQEIEEIPWQSNQEGRKKIRRQPLSTLTHHYTNLLPPKP